MDTIKFEKKGDVYVHEFTATSDYALHIERESEGRFSIMQRSSDSGEYFQCALPPHIGNAGKVLDYTFSHGVYPMNVRLESETPVVMATINKAQ